ncbi:hypothetical protein O181_083715 [Austropuccinia psidii MF-1]|uniref:Uncharacterized protein n=1 Tax=Austropuccinia psidii MF-1 TaxID=1389203 RepID=A0A9Q3ILV4_9BASI|nr:hypothetical protein [Austropuccinia psidii MF-1]
MRISFIFTALASVSKAIAAPKEAIKAFTLEEVNGVPDNTCLTFRNNGNIVDAACVLTAVDRQIAQDQINGKDVLKVMRTFTPDFREDLVDKQVCIGYRSGGVFRAEDCASADIEFVTFKDGQLRTESGACQKGHNDKAELTVDPAGKECATLHIKT